MSTKNTNAPVDELLKAIDQAVGATNELAKGTVAGRRAALLQKSLTGETTPEENAELAGLLLGQSKDTAELIKGQFLQSDNIESAVDASAAFEDLVKSTSAMIGTLAEDQAASVTKLDERFVAVSGVLGASVELLKSISAAVTSVEARLEKIESLPLPRASVATAASTPVVDRPANGVLGSGETVQKSQRELAGEYIQTLRTRGVSKTLGGNSLFALGTQIKVGGLSTVDFEDLKATAAG